MKKTGILSRVRNSKGGVAGLIGITLLPLAVGGVSSLLTSDAMAQFGRMVQPPLSPPAWLFPVAWTMLYVLMGLASWRIFASEPQTTEAADARKVAIGIYVVQLALNFLWSLVFFGAGLYWAALVVLLVMWALIIALVVLARRIDRTASLLLLPYLAWTTFAAYLNIGVAVLN